MASLKDTSRSGLIRDTTNVDETAANPHIPKFISEAPWYAEAKDGLNHQKQVTKKKSTKFNKWYARGQFEKAATQYRPGACTNCGAMTHSAKDCLDRPRKKGAKWTGEDIKPDEILVDLDMNFEEKHDRWNGYNPDMYSEVMETYEDADIARRRILAQRNDGLAEVEVDSGRLPTEIDTIRADVLDDEEYSLAQFEKRDPKTRSTSKNLRIREDTAKYLRDLGDDSARYDPKSRTLEGEKLEDDLSKTVGSNFVKYDEEEQRYIALQRFAWEAREQGGDLIPSVAPSQAENSFKKYKESKQLMSEEKTKALAELYGEQSKVVSSIPSALLYGQNEVFQKYTPTGQLVKEDIIGQSKYEEDVYLNNHTYVFGSYYEEGHWGYKCCRQTVKLSYCTGEAGIQAKEELKLKLQELKNSIIQIPDEEPSSDEESSEDSSSSIEKEKKRSKRRKSSKRKSKSKKKSKSSRKKRKRDKEEKSSKRPLKKAKFGLHEAIDKEEMDDYKKHRLRQGDPLAQMRL